jgi:RNA 3'-terminal phosphate cyclase
MSLTESAAEELEAWELSAMRDPRNWVRPAAAVVVGGSAGVGLVLLRARHRTRPKASSLGGARTAAERIASDLTEQTRRLLGDR